jgi:nitrate reductase assembly molybdenum cofactor insertion protein NarJ
MDGYKRYEITNASFEEFVNFLFDQQVVPIPDDAKLLGPWYYNAEVAYDPIRVASQYIQLFISQHSCSLSSLAHSWSKDFGRYKARI